MARLGSTAHTRPTPALHSRLTPRRSPRRLHVRPFLSSPAASLRDALLHSLTQALGSAEVPQSGKARAGSASAHISHNSDVTYKLARPPLAHAPTRRAPLMEPLTLHPGLLTCTGRLAGHPYGPARVGVHLTETWHTGPGFLGCFRSGPGRAPSSPPPTPHFVCLSPLSSARSLLLFPCCSALCRLLHRVPPHA